MKKSVLVIEDDDAIRESLKELLVDEGYQVHCAENGLRGLEVLRGTGPDLPGLILLDLTMPVMSGAEFLQHQKTDQTLQTVPVAVFTAAGGKSKPELADDFLRKPVQLDALIGLVQKYCDSPAATL